MEEIISDLAMIEIINKPEIVELDREPFEPVSGAESWFVGCFRD